MGKFVIRKTNTGIKFDLKASNGEVIATSEVYTSPEACQKGIASVQKNAPVAAVENQTVEGFTVEKHPKFEVYTDKAGEFRFRLKATNGQIIAVNKNETAPIFEIADYGICGDLFKVTPLLIEAIKAAKAAK